MGDSDQLAFDVGDTITIFVLSADGAVLDVIDNVDLGDRIEAHRNGRTSLKEAALWAYVATKRFERSRPRTVSEPAERRAIGPGSPRSPCAPPAEEH